MSTKEIFRWFRSHSPDLKRAPERKRAPSFFQAEEIRKEAVTVLKDRPPLGTPANLLYRVALRNDEGGLSLECFRKKFDGYMDRTAQEVHLGNPHAWVDAGAIECVIAHTVQYAQERVYDVNGQLVPLEGRTVLDPQYLADRLDALKKEGNWSRAALQQLLETAPVKKIKDVDITGVAKRSAVLKWERRLEENLKKCSGGIDIYFRRDGMS